MADLSLQVTRSADFREITITNLGGNLSALTSIILNLYTVSTSSVYKTYTFSEAEVSAFISNDTIDLTFLKIAGYEFMPDNWYITQVTANSLAYISNYDGFGSHANVKAVVYQNLNWLRTPEKYKGTIEPIAMQIMWLDNLDTLDTSTIISRDVMYKKRLTALLKTLTA
jgi:hypothetical protein